MIGQLRGKVVAKKPPQIVIDVGGVGYEVQVPMSTLAALPTGDTETTLLTQLIVRDDALVLYGFMTDDERGLFQELTRVSGVGPKMALTILSGMNPADFVATVDADDSDRLTGLPGVGKKTAARLVVEMRDRLAASNLALSTPQTAVTGSTRADSAPSSRTEARDALVALGYKSSEAERLLAGAADEDETADETVDAETLIRRALKRAVR
ncbi:Holliday junction branch migration protein RuvA [Salinisphaera sp. USBA-960]|uniref:Holliday junction branch migration protein RuvA n=1 Tax=Salinisphaera orenii TaxID=856731 RepID=UPI000DBE9D8C|nr:Holliday junction branch migration protein RuvA [Salifodinibacter halophilus]NNC25986.1 Holliday junction branch migration protein RuvA [Salifodinibacter halophilus]